MQYVSIAYKDRFVEVLRAHRSREQQDHTPPSTRRIGPVLGRQTSRHPRLCHNDPQPLPPFVGDYAAGTLRIIWQESPGEEQTFTEIWLPDDTIGLQTNRGTFVTAEGDGNGSPLAISRRELGPGEKFNYLQPPQELLPKPPDPAEGAIEGVGGIRMNVEGHDRDNIRDQIFRPLNP
jgi:hypothetical protein